MIEALTVLVVERLQTPALAEPLDDRRRCEHCGKSLGQNATKRKKYCGDKCRLAAYRSDNAKRNE